MVKTSGDTAVEVRDLVRAYPGRNGELIKANDGLSFSVPRGQVFGLFGANGAGKTTLVLQLLGLVRPTSGSIMVNGVDVTRYPETVKSTVGFLPQAGLSMRLIETRRALHYTGRLRGQSEADARRQTDALIDELGLGPYADRQVERLSGGLMRLVNFGMTLMGHPELIVLDEPTNELDPHNRRLIWEMIERRSTLEGATVVLVTHNVLEAEKAVHRVAVMHGGRITAMGTPGELKEQIGAHARLELFVRDGGSLTPEEISRLSTVGEVSQGNRSGNYLITAATDRLQPLIEVLVTDIGVKRVDDFRFARPTLEDVYLTLNPRQDSDAAAARELVTTPAGGGGSAESGDAGKTAAAAAPNGHRPAAMELPSGESPAAEPPSAELPAGEPPSAEPPSAEPAAPVSGTSRRARARAQSQGRGRMPLRERLGRFGTSFKYLWFEHMLTVRTSWHVHMVFGIFMPLTMVFGFSRIGSGLTDELSLTYIASGSGVFAIAALGTTAIAQRIGAIKAEGSMLYYASLPISKVAFVMAFVAARLLLIAPGLVTSLIAVRLLYGLDLTLSPMLLIVYPLTALPLAALGLVIGSLIDRIELISIVTYVLNFVLLLGAPLLIPAKALPLPLKALSWVMPTTYGSDAIRRSVSDNIDATFGLDILVLTVMTALALTIADRSLRWRAS
ncbi:putative ABC transporter, ATP-binding protein [Streptomyces himastatinicus ATCC 53653]|uniref:Putative ABC transporter, ATP-binding protein n=1 Tax=Streptomyces himastatinicus ATCC 53653 TaxID=457427 RepID=D9WB00_9ACTN|nr:ABC transporter ATP-binding protein/permease [Streptomyces himastatinicus]EFL20794.1 putative ABC transporter, ATP-binding protein [Streptomyces himastatinicus ATCC 53653]